MNVEADENGRFNPSADVVTRAARLLGLTANNLSPATFGWNTRPSGLSDDELNQRKQQRRQARIDRISNEVSNDIGEVPDKRADILMAAKGLARYLNLALTRDPDGRFYLNGTSNFYKLRQNLDGAAKIHPAWSVVSNWNKFVSGSKAYQKFVSRGSKINDYYATRQQNKIKNAVKRAYRFATDRDYATEVRRKMQDSQQKFQNKQEARLALLGLAVQPVRNNG